MTISSLSIKGLRGFATSETLTLAQPDGTSVASGLTVLVGPNNGGKSTIVEAFRALASGGKPSFTEGKRNQAAGDRVELRLQLSDGSSHSLTTNAAGGSETVRSPVPGVTPSALVLPSRRYFNVYFGKGIYTRDQFSHIGLPSIRSQPLDEFGYRLFETIGNAEKLRQFNEILGRVVRPCPDWTIDQQDSGQYYLKVKSGDAFHNSDGMGEGIVSLFFIINALYDSKPNDLIVIDEPELSLHPMYQRHLAALLVEYAKDRQIVYATHSPYFLPLDKVDSGLTISRVYKAADSRCRIAAVSDETKHALARLTKDSNNPHVLGLDAREVFFLEDAVLLVEGQEDVVCYRRITEELNVQLPCEFFGWGVGGAEKMEVIAQLLHELGYQKVAGILDGDKPNVAKQLGEKYPGYKFMCIPMDDVRTKPARAARPPKTGLLDERLSLRDDMREPIQQIFNDIRTYMTPAQ
jgi:energy-coupling factor transporter ATP-binding protein EcfA2